MIDRMSVRGQCPYTKRGAGAGCLHCVLLLEKNEKWDFCIKQFFCRTTGKYEVSKEAADCCVRNKKDGD